MPFYGQSSFLSPLLCIFWWVCVRYQEVIEPTFEDVKCLSKTQSQHDGLGVQNTFEKLCEKKWLYFLQFVKFV